MIHYILACLLAIWVSIRWFHLIALALHVACMVAAGWTLGEKGYAIGVRGLTLTVLLVLSGVFGLAVAVLLPTAVMRPRAAATNLYEVGQ